MTSDQNPAWLRMIASGSDTRSNAITLLCSSLSNLLLQALAGIAHALVLVRVRRTQPAHFGGNLPHLLAIDSGQSQLRLLRIHRDLDARGQRILDRMRIAKVKHHRALALHLGAITYADDFQFPRPSLGDALDGIVDQSTS